MHCLSLSANISEVINQPSGITGKVSSGAYLNSSGFIQFLGKLMARDTKNQQGPYNKQVWSFGFLLPALIWKLKHFDFGEMCFVWDVRDSTFMHIEHILSREFPFSREKFQIVRMLLALRFTKPELYVSRDRRVKWFLLQKSWTQCLLAAFVTFYLCGMVSFLACSKVRWLISCSFLFCRICN